MTTEVRSYSCVAVYSDESSSIMRLDAYDAADALVAVKNAFPQALRYEVQPAKPAGWAARDEELQLAEHAQLRAQIERIVAEAWQPLLDAVCAARAAMERKP